MLRMSLGIQKRSASNMAKPRDPFSRVEIPILSGITVGAFRISSALNGGGFSLDLEGH